MTRVDRRSFLRLRRHDSQSIAASFSEIGPAARARQRSFDFAQGRPLIPVRALNHMTLSVSDPKRSLDFYQGLFGMPIQARQGQTTLLRIGAGPQFLALERRRRERHAEHQPLLPSRSRTSTPIAPSRRWPSTASRAPMAAGGGLSGGPMKARVRMRGPESGGAPGGTPELYFGDPDGIVVQLQDATLLRRAGRPRRACAAPPSQRRRRDCSRCAI